MQEPLRAQLLPESGMWRGGCLPGLVAERRPGASGGRQAKVLAHCVSDSEPEICPKAPGLIW